MSDCPKTTREDRFRAWRKLGFGPDEAWRRADMPDIQPSQQQTALSERDVLPVILADCCYVCKGTIGVFRWTDQSGHAHPWCIESEKPNWETVRGKR